MGSTIGTPVRLRPEGYEYRCPECREWWPLSREFWPKTTMAYCLGCDRERNNAKARLRYPAFRADPIQVARYRRINRAAQQRRRAA